ncbi:NHL repeat-containing protein, partial [candidate division KSB1 bacterium]
MKNRLLFILCLFLLTFHSCEKDNLTYELEIIGEKKYINNLMPVISGHNQIRLKFSRKIGQLEGEDENLQLFRPGDVARDRDGNYYIVDTGNNRIQKYDKDLHYLMTFGRQGQGPGELDQPDYIYIEENGNVYIGNLGNNRVEVFNPDGSYSNVIKTTYVLPITDFTKRGNIATVARNSNYESFGDMLSNVSEAAPLVAILDTNLSILNVFGEERKYDNRMMQIFGNMFKYASDEAGNHYITYYYQNRLDKYDPDGTLLYSAKRTLDYDETVSVQSSTEFRNKFAEGMQVDNKGRIWIQTYRRQFAAGEW